VCGGQENPSASRNIKGKLTIDNLPQTSISFKTPDHELPLPAQVMLIGHPFCSSNGTTFLQAQMPPDYAVTSIVAIPPKGEVKQYPVPSVPGLTNIVVRGMDAIGSDVFLFVQARKGDVVSEHDQKPELPENFVIHVSPGQTGPEAIPLHVSFQPVRVAALGKNEFLVLGIDMINKMPTMALVDSSGDVERIFDSMTLLGQTDDVVKNASKQISGEASGLPDDWAKLSVVLSAAEFAHSGDSLLFLLPGRKNEMLTLSQNGSISSMRLRLPEGFDADSLVPSDKYWLVRAVNTSGKSEKPVLLLVNPGSGEVMRVIRTQPFSAEDISCVYDGQYIGLRWIGEKDKGQWYLIRSTE
jgi:hypothetical protein